MVSSESVARDELDLAAASAAVVAPLGENEAAVIDTFAVPTYLRLYWDVLRPLLLVGEASRVVHLMCLTGYPDGELLSIMPNTTGVGVDAALPCLSVAAAKMDAFGFDYVHAMPEATPLPSDNFSHALLLHAPGQSEERRALFGEMSRLVYAGGQVLVGLPLSDSFPEIVDLLAEFALKYDHSELSLALEGLAAGRVTPTMIEEELETAGFSDIQVVVETASLTFDSGRALLEDPAVRFFILPQLQDWLESEALHDAMHYVARAVDKYWSDERLELGLKIAGVSARA